MKILQVSLPLSSQPTLSSLPGFVLEEEQEIQRMIRASARVPPIRLMNPRLRYCEQVEMCSAVEAVVETIPMVSFIIIGAVPW